MILNLILNWPLLKRLFSIQSSLLIWPSRMIFMNQLLIMTILIQEVQQVTFFNIQIKLTNVVVLIEEHAQDSDCCPLNSSDIASSTHHLGKSNFYEKVVKSIQKSIRRIFHSPQSSKTIHMREGEGSLDMVPISDNNLSEIPSMAINPLISPITSVTPDHATSNHTNPLSLHKTLLIDVAYSVSLSDKIKWFRWEYSYLSLWICIEAFTCWANLNWYWKEMPCPWFGRNSCS